MRLNVRAASALAVVALVMLASGAAGAAPTAAQVNDDASLKAFVEGAKAEIEAITDMNEGARLRERLRTEGDWKAGSMFLVIFLMSGEPFIHGNDRTAESKNLLGVEDERGTKVVEELFAAAAGGGGFVEYQDGGPKTAYAVEYTSGITARRFVLVGGYSQDVSDVPILTTDLPKPAVVASQVKDRETLITFVEEVKLHLPVGREWRGRYPVSRIGAVSRRQAHGHGENRLPGDQNRGGVDRRCAARGSEVPAISLRQPGHRQTASDAPPLRIRLRHERSGSALGTPFGARCSHPAHCRVAR